MTFCGVNRNFITRVSVTRHAHAWICCKTSFQSDSGFRRAIRNNDLTRVLAVAHAHTAAMMERDPGCAADNCPHAVGDSQPKQYTATCHRDACSDDHAYALTQR